MTMPDTSHTVYITVEITLDETTNEQQILIATHMLGGNTRIHLRKRRDTPLNNIEMDESLYLVNALVARWMTKFAPRTQGQLL